MSKRNDDHIKNILNTRSFTTQTFSAMNELCKSAMQKFGISAFEYARVYDNNSAFMLYSDPKIATYVINNEVHISAHAPKEIIKNEFWVIPESTGKYSDVLLEIKEISNSFGLANHIQRHMGYYEMFCYWTEHDQNVSTNKIINLKESLEQFSSSFVDQAKDLISHVDKDRFTLTEPMLPNFRGLEANQQSCIINLNFYLEKFRQELIKLNAQITYPLTTQELKCIFLLIEGKTAADMAQILNLSPRTIEMHLNSVKLKLDCRKKSDIIGNLLELAEKHPKK